MNPASQEALKPPAHTATTTTTTPRHDTTPPPPTNNEKYAYIHRNLPYLTTSLIVSAGCLIISQVRFEAHDPVAWPFMVFTATYVVYQVIGLPVNFTGRVVSSAGAVGSAVVSMEAKPSRRRSATPVAPPAYMSPPNSGLLPDHPP